jgi:hypothetical protein
MPMRLDRLTPVEEGMRSIKRRVCFAGLLFLFVLGTYLYWRILPEAPEEHLDIREHFKYGSIGSDNTERGVPYRLWKVLPEMFPEHLPNHGQGGYLSLGLIAEPGHDRPIGFSQRRVLGIELVGLNCAVCHTGSYRDAPQSAPVIVLGMPSNTVNLQEYFRFLFRCAADQRFTVDKVMDRLKAQGGLDWYERLIYPRVIRQFRDKVLAQKEKVSYWDKIPDFGPGRVDTFTPYKRLYFDLPIGNAIGTADFPSLWNQQQRHDSNMNQHLHGNNSNV